MAMSGTAKKLKNLLKGYPDTWVRDFGNGMVLVGFESHRCNDVYQARVILHLQANGVECKDSGNARGTVGYCTIFVTSVPA